MLMLIIIEVIFLNNLLGSALKDLGRIEKAYSDFLTA